MNTECHSSSDDSNERILNMMELDTRLYTVRWGEGEDIKKKLQ
jgi:hypothetical protein